jgi:hypothetical protein
MIGNRTAQVVDPDGQQRIVRRTLARLRQVDERGNATFEQLRQARAGEFGARPTGVLTGEDFAGKHPVGVGERRRSRGRGG